MLSGFHFEQISIGIKCNPLNQTRFLGEIITELKH